MLCKLCFKSVVEIDVSTFPHNEYMAGKSGSRSSQQQPDLCQVNACNGFFPGKRVMRESSRLRVSSPDNGIVPVVSCGQQCNCAGTLPPFVSESEANAGIAPRENRMKFPLNYGSYISSGAWRTFVPWSGGSLSRSSSVSSTACLVGRKAAVSEG